MKISTSLLKNPDVIKNLKYDIPAGIVVFLVALPLCLGIALASGAPLFSGILSGIVGGVVVTLFSKSQLGVSGPAAGLVVIVAAAIQNLGSFEMFLLAVVLAGFIQVILGSLNAGIIAYLFPSSVIKGMLTAIGLILILKQLPHALGYDHEMLAEGLFNGSGAINEIRKALNHWEWGGLIITVVSFFIVLIWEKTSLKKKAWLPSALVIVIVAILLNLLFIEKIPALALGGEHLVSIPDFRKAPKLNFPDFSAGLNPEVWFSAVTIGIVASIETLLTIEAVDKLDPWKRQTPLSRELYAQGLGNIVAGFIGGLPITAVIVRSTANIGAGGRTKVAAFVHGVFLLLCVLFIPYLLNLIPIAALALILLVVGFKLATPKVFAEAYKEGSSYFIPFITTVIAILFTDLLIGIGIGTVVGLFFVIKTNFHSVVSVKHEEKEVVVILEKDVSFLNKTQLLKILEKLPKGKDIVVDGSKAEFIDYDIHEIIRNFKTSSDLKHRKVELRNMLDKQGHR